MGHFGDPVRPVAMSDHPPGLREIYEVVYPDIRRGPGGVSAVLFRTHSAASAFARRYGAEVVSVWVTAEALKRLRNERRLEQGR